MRLLGRCKRRKTFAVQGDLRQDGKRAASITVTIADARETPTREARATAKEYLAKISRGQHPKAEELAKKEEVKEPAPIVGITLRAAWERYRDAHMVRKGRSERTIDSYRDLVGRHEALEHGRHQLGRIGRCPVAGSTAEDLGIGDEIAVDGGRQLDGDLHRPVVRDGGQLQLGHARPSEHRTRRATPRAACAPCA